MSASTWDEPDPVDTASWRTAVGHLINPESISKHDDTCRNCRQPDQFSRERPESRQMSGEFFDCGKIGQIAPTPRPSVHPRGPAASAMLRVTALWTVLKKYYLIAKEQTVPSPVSFQKTSKPCRAILAEGWPKTSEENIQRLHDAGIPMDNLKPYYTDCKQSGHSVGDCP
ncbi:hypothetical protein E4T48_06134 [Aureobasidium sp. EXF-10727]|nr:hypothetical protein E4T48_06134 [Aureobasidium sp. EXF-10727]